MRDNLNREVRYWMMREPKMEKPMTKKTNPEEDRELSFDELEKVAGGFSLRDAPTIETTDIDEDTESKV
jgi:hypothetical protein